MVLGSWVENHIRSLDEKGIRDLVDVLNLVSLANVIVGCLIMLLLIYMYINFAIVCLALRFTS